VKRILPAADQGLIIPPLRLLADPKMQDLRTTYVEHLAFEAECLDVLARAARRLEKRAKIAGKCEVAKAKAEQQQQCRVDWVLSEIEKTEEEQKDAAGEGSSRKTGSSKKRRPTDGTDRTPNKAN
jgi:hypothetical protein